jgi:proton-dependent oligopeptide transporter, POT family
MATQATAESQGTILGHPKGLFVLFFAEMWERMSYYGMRALLMMYMIKHLLGNPDKMADVMGLSTLKQILEIGFGPLEVQPFASHIYGLYIGLAYLSPFFGGLLADKVWGKRKSVYIGGILMIIGHLMMGQENLFLPALFILIMGNGAFKPNISTQVGSLYPEGDKRRDGAFTLFYMGINLGAFISPFLCDNFAHYINGLRGITDEVATSHLGFTFAGIGMAVGLIVYHFGQKYLNTHDEETIIQDKKERSSFSYKAIGSFFLTVAAFIGFLMLSGILKAIVIIGVVVGIVYWIRQIKDSGDRTKVAALMFIFMAVIAFWAIFEQQGNTLQIWADEKADFARLGLKATNYQSFNPLFILMFAPLMNMFWEFRARKGKTSSSVRKMAVGSFLAGLAFLVMALAADYISIEKSLMNMFWLAIVTWIFTLGELYLSPIGLSLVTKVAPKHMVSMMMGLWFVASAIGGYLSGYLGADYATTPPFNFFMKFAVLGAGVGVLFLLAEKKMEKAIGSDI